MPKSQIRLDRDKKRKTKFLQHLAISSQVAQSAEIAKIPTSTLYRWREQDGAFRQNWILALAAGYELLEMELLHRARKGVDKAVFYGGGIVATVKEYDNGLAFRLLMAHKDMVAKTRAFQNEQVEQTAQLRQTLDQKISKMRERLERREAEKDRSTSDGPDVDHQKDHHE